MSELHTSGWFLAIGTAFMIIAIVFAIIVIRSVYKRIDGLSQAVVKSDMDTRDARHEMKAIAKAYSSQSEETHAILMSINSRMENLEKSMHGKG